MAYEMPLGGGIHRISSLSVVLDLFFRRVVGWLMKTDRDASLVMDALIIAV